MTSLASHVYSQDHRKEANGLQRCCSGVRVTPSICTSCSRYPPSKPPTTARMAILSEVNAAKPVASRMGNEVVAFARINWWSFSRGKRKTRRRPKMISKSCADNDVCCSLQCCMDSEAKLACLLGNVSLLRGEEVQVRPASNSLSSPRSDRVPASRALETRLPLF